MSWVVGVLLIFFYVDSGNEHAVHRDMMDAFDAGSGTEMFSYPGGNGTRLILRSDLQSTLHAVVAHRRRRGGWAGGTSRAGEAGRASRLRCGQPRAPLRLRVGSCMSRFPATASQALLLLPQGSGHAGHGPALLDALFRTFEVVAERYMETRNKPLVLIVDAADYITGVDVAGLKGLQRWAKRGADTGLWRVVLVTSEGAALPVLPAESARGC